MANDPVQDKWMLDALGLDVSLYRKAAPSPAGFDPAAFASAEAAWQTASSVVDTQLNGLRRLLLAQDDPELKEIAEKGLNAITGQRKVGLAAALMDVRRSGDPAAAAKALGAARAYRSFVESDSRVAACDACPQPPVSIRATLAPALSLLEQALGA